MQTATSKERAYERAGLRLVTNAEQSDHRRSTDLRVRLYLRLFLLFAFLVAVGLLAGCSKKPQSESETTNTEFVVGLLFEHDGCKVYRFKDAGERIYYTNCSSTAWTEKRVYNCGDKNRQTCTEETPRMVANVPSQP